MTRNRLPLHSPYHLLNTNHLGGITLKTALKGIFMGILCACALLSGFIHIWLWIFLPYCIPLLIISIGLSITRKDFAWIKEDPLFLIYSVAPILGFTLSFIIAGGGQAAGLLDPPVWIKWVIGGAVAIFGAVVGLGAGLPDAEDDELESYLADRFE